MFLGPDSSVDITTNSTVDEINGILARTIDNVKTDSISILSNNYQFDYVTSEFIYHIELNKLTIQSSKDLKLSFYNFNSFRPRFTGYITRATRPVYEEKLAVVRSLHLVILQLVFYN